MASERASAADRALVGLLGALAVLAALAMGGVAPWARSAIFALAVAIVAAWMVGRAAAGHLEIERHPVWLFLLGFLGLAALQLLPLPRALLSAVQPATAAAYTQALPEYAAQSPPRALSLCPPATSAELLRVVALALVLFTVLHAVRTRGQILALVAVLLGLGAFEALYGLYERFSGSHAIFGLSHPYAGEAVTGTFLNKNHFAGLLEMLVPVALGLFFALRSSRRPFPRSRRGAAALRRFQVALAIRLSSPRFAVRAAVAGLAVVMTAAVLLSLSRAGVLALAVALGLLVVLGMTRAGFRRHAVALVAFVALVLATTGAVGMSAVADRLDDAASGQSAQWADRVDLSRSALPYVRDFPILGSGLGTFGAVFPRYQSGRFGDRWANYLHNDWLQLVCEMGVLGGLVLAAGLAVLLASIARRLRRQESDSAWWITAGALAGVAAMLVHSLFDYNLSRITSNGLIFCMLLGLAFRAASLGGARGAGDRLTAAAPRTLRLSLRPLPVRLAWGALGLVLAGGAVALALGPARADVAFNRYRLAVGEERTEDYFFLDAVAPGAVAATEADDPLDLAARAHALAPRNPTYAYHLGLAALARADAPVRARAVASARAVLGDVDAPGEGAVDALAASLVWSLRPALRAERRPWLERAAAHLRGAIARAPTVAEYHGALAGVEQELEGGPGAGLRSIETALVLAPARPSILCRAGLFFLERAPVDARGVPVPERREFIHDCLRRAIAADSAYAGRIFPVVRAVYGGTAPLLDITPPTVPAHGNLLLELWAAGDWEHVERCLDMLEALAGSCTSTRLTVSRHRTELLAMQARWEEHGHAVVSHRHTLRESLAPVLAEAGRLRAAGRPPEAMQQLREVLAADWSHPEARIAAAELASLPRVSAQLAAGEAPLDHVLDLVLHVESWPEWLYRRALAVLAMEDPGQPDGVCRRELLHAAAEIRSGRTAAGLAALGRVLAPGAPASDTSPLEPLAWFLVGEAEERRQDREAAIGAHRRVLERAPDHRDALAALVRLGETSAWERLAELTPDVPLSATFGGRVRLLGYRFWPGASGGGGAHLACYWQLLGAPGERYRPSVHFLDAARRRILAADHDFASGGARHWLRAPHPGEVRVTVVELEADLLDAVYLAVAVVAPGDGAAAAAVLRPDWGVGGRVVGALRRAAEPVAARFRVASP
ncbi:MAG: O-antigen ligase family protein [Planctomycetes bacterium]|nr:O-antigen ligase family protein [Planctomycetota bacterium]